MSSEQDPPIDYRALAEFRYQIRRFLRFSEQVAREAGLEPQHYQLLLALKGLPEGRKATITELAERLQIQHHSAVELINRLVERDLVGKQRDVLDQRQVILSLTPRGEEVLQTLAAYHRAELQIVGPALVAALKAILTDSALAATLQESESHHKNMDQEDQVAQEDK
ncbi:MAG: winged helix-turn-helix transcriptional regulator [Thermogemmatispora sp.]|uniref:MarR family winged helix-turn-helix transcriptional regulator n=1 Tax=Thermogemmatispora sp. TaxID=1968838 RepID=UPI00260B41E2|nr:MarR family winged helix-turn-helix transcriptional regulator [Thermogemmatispora sp.]MBX5458933.1 winged helix-turn-helix transcriptional regulator [Thermogemmatispora sp.]